MARISITTGVLIVLGIHGFVLADDIHVPGDVPTIQAGIDAANDGDTVLVADGSYTGPGNRDLDFGGKLITVRSENGPQGCIIDCQGSAAEPHRGFNFHSGEPPAAVVDGFTIMNGYAASGIPHADFGGGINVFASNPTITNCTFVGNSACAGGALAYNLTTGATLSNCTITGNSHWCSGGGIYCNDTVGLEITDCTISGNANGMFIVASSPTITHCTITESAGRGVVFQLGGSPLISHCLVSGNGGRGITCFVGTSPTITHCTITGNTAIGTGGGGRGAGIRSASGSSPTISNCTICDNSAQMAGGGIRIEDGMAVLSNNILWGNSAPDGPELSLANVARVTADYNDVAGGQAAVSVSEDSVLIWGAGNMDANPIFTDADGPDDDPQTWQDNDLRLASSSPCIDAGDNTAVPPDAADLDGNGDSAEPIPIDLDGNPRFVDDPLSEDTGNGDCPVADMGAYEFQEGVTDCCAPDLNGDDQVDSSDLALLLGAWGPNPDHPADFDGDDQVDAVDLALLLGSWGVCP